MPLRRRGAAAPVLLAVALAAAAWPRAGAAWHQCSAQAVYGGAYGYQALANLTEFRLGLLSSVWPYATDTSGWKEDEGWGRYDIFNPVIACPPSQPLVRVGSRKDGGKILCDVSRLEPPCVIYSLGSYGDFSFERDMLQLTRCEIHTFDCTYDGEPIHSRHRYHKTCLGRPTQPLFEDYAGITQRLGHAVVDFLKIDIEGHEPSVLESLVNNRGHLPRQITIEMHMRNAVGAVAPSTTVEMSVLFYHMALLGYGVISREDNLWGVHGCCAEFTFLHVEQAHRFRRQRGDGKPQPPPAGSAAGAAPAAAGGKAPPGGFLAWRRKAGGQTKKQLPWKQQQQQRHTRQAAAAPPPPLPTQQRQQQQKHTTPWVPDVPLLSAPGAGGGGAPGGARRLAAAPLEGARGGDSSGVGGGGLLEGRDGGWRWAAVGTWEPPPEL